MPRSNRIVHLHEDSLVMGVHQTASRGAASQAGSGLNIFRGCSRGWGEDEVCLWQILNFPAAVAGPSQGLGTVTAHIASICTSKAHVLALSLSKMNTVTTSTINSYPPPQQNSTLQCTHFSPWGEGVRLNSATDVTHTAAWATERCSGARAEEGGGLAPSFLQPFLHSLQRSSPFTASTHTVTRCLVAQHRWR